MATRNQVISKDLQKEWDKHKSMVSAVQLNLPDIDRDKRVKRALKDFQFFANTYFTHYTTYKGKTIPLAEFHLAAAEILKNPPNDQFFCALEWARGHAKSTVATLMIPIWLMLQGKTHMNLVISKTRENATKLLIHIQSELTHNALLISDFGPFKTIGSWEKFSFSIEKYRCSFFSLGRSQDPRGLRYENFRVDAIYIDDIDDNEVVRSKQRISEAWEWLMESVVNTTSPNGYRIVICENLYSDNSIMSKFLQIPGVWVSKVDAIKADGTISWPSYYTREWLDRKRATIGTIAFDREYQNKPVVIGQLFKAEWFKYANVEIEKFSPDYKMVVLYFDPSWGEGKGSDYKAVSVLGYDGVSYIIDKIFLRKASINAAVSWIYQTYEEYLAQGVVCHCYMEANMGQHVIWDGIQTETKRRGYSLPINLDKKQKASKHIRIEALTPYFERSQMIFNNLNMDSDMKEFIEQLLQFEHGSKEHDDGPDSLEGALININSMIRTMNVDNIIVDYKTNDWDAVAFDERSLDGWQKINMF